jgi:phosphocarrier protein HPr
MMNTDSDFNIKEQSYMTREVVIRNQHGLHARPAALFVKTANRFAAEIWVEKEGERINGKSIMGLMMLAAAKRSRLRLTAIGEDASSLLDALEELVQSGFGEAYS